MNFKGAKNVAKYFDKFYHGVVILDTIGRKQQFYL